jgi:hypothetical protein
MTAIAIGKVIAGILAAMAPFLMGWAVARNKDKAAKAEGYRDTRKKMDAAPRHTDADVARQRMRDRKP